MTERYPSLMRWMHWTMGLLIVIVLAIGLLMGRVEPGPVMNKLFDLHRSLGLIALGLIILRAWLRWRGPLPPDVPGMPPVQTLVVKIVHLGFYGILLALPVLGWLGSSAYGAPVIFFGQFTLPALVGPDKALAAQLFFLHEVGAFTLIGLIILHVLGVLYHQFVLRDGLLHRMGPF